MDNTNPAVPDYRNGQSLNPTVMQNQSSNTPLSQGLTPSSSSYVNALKTKPKITYPKREQAIIMSAVGSLKLAEYVYSLAEIIDPKEIISASRIANNRICIYLTNKDLVDQIVESRTSLQVADQEVGIRRLVTPAKRIVISNAPSNIPNEVIETYLKQLGLSLVSPVSFLRAGIMGDKFAHILSFRRQVYVAPPTDTLVETNPSILITFEDIDYRIYLTNDDMLCFLCKLKGHVANNCPNVSSNNQITPPSQQDPSQQSQQPLNSSQERLPSSNESVTETDPTLHSDRDNVRLQLTIANEPEAGKQVKRLLSSDTGTPSSSIEVHDIFAKPSDTNKAGHHVSRKDNTPKHKKVRTCQSPSATRESELETIKQLHDQGVIQFSIPHDSFRSFLENAQGNQDPLTEARRFTDDVRSLLKTMYDLYPHLASRSAKSRLTRISKRIKEQLKMEGFEVASIASNSPPQSQERQQEDPDTDLRNVSTDRSSSFF